MIISKKKNKPINPHIKIWESRKTLKAKIGEYKKNQMINRQE